MNSYKTLIVVMLLIGANLAMSSNKPMPMSGIIKYHPMKQNEKKMNILDLEDVFEDSKSFFSIVDKDRDGNISAEELNHVLNLLGEKIPMSSVKAMIEKLDDDKNGLINFKEFFSLKPEEQLELKEDLEDLIIQQIHNRKRDPTPEEKEFIYCALEKRNEDLIKKSIINSMSGMSPEEMKYAGKSPEEMKGLNISEIPDQEKLSPGEIQKKASKYRFMSPVKNSGIISIPMKGKAQDVMSPEEMKGLNIFGIRDQENMSPEEMKEYSRYGPTNGKAYKCNYREGMKYPGIMIKKEEMKYAPKMSPEEMKYAPLGRFAVRDMKQTVAVGIIKEATGKEVKGGKTKGKITK